MTRTPLVLENTERVQYDSEARGSTWATRSGEVTVGEAGHNGEAGRKVMVTGGTGFIGGHLLSALVAAGHTPRVLVRDPAKLAVVRELHGLGAVSYTHLTLPTNREV